MKIRSSALIGIRQRRPILAIALKTGSLTSALMFVGLFGACSLGTSNVGPPVAALTKSVAENHFLFTRLDHAVVNQHSTAHDSDLPGASIAQYEQSTGQVLTLSTEPFESGFVGSQVLPSPTEPFESGFVGSQVLASPAEPFESGFVGSQVLASPTEPFESGFVGSQVLTAPTEILKASIVRNGF